MSNKIITLDNLAEFKAKCDETYGDGTKWYQHQFTFEYSFSGDSDTSLGKICFVADTNAEITLVDVGGGMLAPKLNTNNTVKGINGTTITEPGTYNGLSIAFGFNIGSQGYIEIWGIKKGLNQYGQLNGLSSEFCNISNISGHTVTEL